MTSELTEVAVAVAADIVEGERGVAVVAEERSLALFRVDGEIVAFDGECPHRRGPIAEGDVRGGVVTCPWHWWRYELRTGRRVDDAAVALARHPVAVRDGVVFVKVPPAAAPESLRARLLRHAYAERSP